MADFDLAAALAQIDKTYGNYDGYGQVGSAISNVQIPYAYGTSPWTQFGTTIAKGLLGGAIQGYGAGQAQNFNAAAQTSLINALRGTPATAETVAGSADAARGINDLARMRIWEQQQNEAAKNAVDASDVRKALAIEEGKARINTPWLFPDTKAPVVESVGTVGADKTGAVKASDYELMSPPAQKRYERDQAEQSKQEATVRAESAAIAGSQTGKIFEIVNPAFQNLVANIGGSDKAAKEQAYIALAHLADPNGAITDSSIAGAKNSLPYVQAKFGDFLNDINAAGPIDPKTQIAILESAAKVANSYGSQYDSLVNQHKAIASAFGAPADLVASIPVTTAHVPAIPEIGAYGAASGIGIAPTAAAATSQSSTIVPTKSGRLWDTSTGKYVS